MNINKAYNSNGSWDILGAYTANNDINTKKQGLLTEFASGDTVAISDEARQLLADALQKYQGDEQENLALGLQDQMSETPNSFSPVGKTDTDNEKPSTGSGNPGGTPASDNSESIKKQIETLQGQLQTLVGQMNGGAEDAGVNAKISSIRAQIAALQAQLVA